MTPFAVAAAPFDDRPCSLGEGAFWHPVRGQVFWFDILGRRLLTRDAGGPRAWDFPARVSAAGWIDADRLLIASDRALLAFDIVTGQAETVVPLEADDPRTRSNDGRADPWGGFWIGTMGTAIEPGLGSIWRYWRGELRRLFAGITIPNAICFAPDGSFALYTDTPTQVLLRQRLRAADGWPVGEPEPFLDLRAAGQDGTGLNPDGAVIDAAGRLWLAQWGAGRVACHGPDGRFEGAVTVAAPHASCPAFGGPDLATLFVTTAREGMDAAALAAHPQAGMTFAAPLAGLRGQAEHRVIL
jgi:sugar lactone lactonase YvrE